MKNQCPQFDKGRLLLFISLKAFEILIEKKKYDFSSFSLYATESCHIQPFHIHI